MQKKKKKTTPQHFFVAEDCMIDYGNYKYLPAIKKLKFFFMNFEMIT